MVVGGTLFFAFPALYTSAFSGFYLSLIMVLWLLILRGVSIEFRSHMNSAQSQQLWSTVFGLASAALALVLGIALGNVVRGVPVDQGGHLFLPLWKNFSPTGQVGLVDWYTFLGGAALFLAVAVHGSLWVVVKTEGSLQERTPSFCAKCWTASVPIMLLMTAASFSIQPDLMKQFRTHSWGVVFPALAIVGVMGARVLSRPRRDLQAFLGSGLYLAGMLSSVAFGVFPNVVPSNTRPDLGHDLQCGRRGAWTFRGIVVVPSWHGSCHPVFGSGASTFRGEGGIACEWRCLMRSIRCVPSFVSLDLW